MQQSQQPALRQPSVGNLSTAAVKYVFPPSQTQGADRHRVYLNNLTLYGSSNFTAAQYPAAMAGFGHWNGDINNAGSILSTVNENNVSVSVGYARPQSSAVDWLLIVEMSHKEAWEPVQKLRKIVLACVFGAIGLILLFIVPTAHYSVRPIRRLRDATEKSIAPPGYTPNGSIRSERFNGDLSDGDPELQQSNSSHSKKLGLFIRPSKFEGWTKED